MIQQTSKKLLLAALLIFISFHQLYADNRHNHNKGINTPTTITSLHPLLHAHNQPPLSAAEAPNPAPVRMLSADKTNTAPHISISEKPSADLKKYETMEVTLDIENEKYTNPYDPAEIDVYALFETPSGNTIRINGFYDNFQQADTWKLRFSPRETGTYTYTVYVKDIGGTGSTPAETFVVADSEFKGWIRQSEVNPRYFSYDDGTSWYGVGVYSPWRNTLERFDNMEEHKVNIMGLWNITYGGFVNGHGLIEEELGVYNQQKLGQLDSLLSILERKNIKLMYAIWPHDLFSKTVWATQWDKNPYNQLIDVNDVYSDSLVWEYQKKKYRYLIARYAHSSSWGIWELINEMNGTDGWKNGRHEEAYEWVEKCQAYFDAHDPYDHPVTASFSGGFNEYRERLHHIIDVPNIHLYPRQGWKKKYPFDQMRSAMYNYAWASQRFWNSFEKPSIFGESGAEWAYYERPTPEYQESYHNKIWACLTNGLAATPIWWTYTELSDASWDQLKILAEFSSEIDLANKPFKPLKTSAPDTDVYTMGTTSEAFGWARNFEQPAIGGTTITLEGLNNGGYAIYWHDPWTGNKTSREFVSVEGGTVELTVPSIGANHPDIAFRILPW